MHSYSHESPYPSAHRPSEIAQFLGRGMPVAPAGPYYIYDGDSDNPPAQRMCSLGMLADEVSRWEQRWGMGKPLTQASRSIVTYICAGLLKHCGFAVRSNNRKLRMQFARFRLDAEAAIKEAFEFGGTVQDVHTKWIALEQARCVSTVEEFHMLIKDACKANISTVAEIRGTEMAKRGLRGTDRIHALQCIISDLSYLYIDLTVYARRSDQLNTVGERFRLTERQLMCKRQAAANLDSMLSTECKTIFRANEKVVKDVKAKAEDLAECGAGNDPAQLRDGLLAELSARFVSLEHLMVPGVNLKGCMDREKSGRRRKKMLVRLLRGKDG